MVKQILDELKIKNRETRFLKPPGVTYAVYFISFDSRGSDEKNMIRDYSYTIELYEYEPDPETELKIENKLDEMAIEFTKQDRAWIESEQLYQVIYEFEKTTKGGF